MKVNDLPLLNVHLLGCRRPGSLSEELLCREPLHPPWPCLGVPSLFSLFSPQFQCYLFMGLLLLVVVSCLACLALPTTTGC